MRLRYLASLLVFSALSFFLISCANSSSSDSKSGSSGLSIDDVDPVRGSRLESMLDRAAVSDDESGMRAAARIVALDTRERDFVFRAWRSRGRELLSSYRIGLCHVTTAENGSGPKEHSSEAMRWLSRAIEVVAESNDELRYIEEARIRLVMARAQLAVDNVKSATELLYHRTDPRPLPQELDAQFDEWRQRLIAQAASE